MHNQLRNSAHAWQHCCCAPARQSFAAPCITPPRRTASVINELVRSQAQKKGGPPVHVPYRDSRLTFLLQARGPCGREQRVAAERSAPRQSTRDGLASARRATFCVQADSLVIVFRSARGYPLAAICTVCLADGQQPAHGARLR